jgi:hypothetical protein
VKEDRPVFVVRLIAASPNNIDPIKALRRAPKTLARRFGFRCVSITQEELRRE